MNGAFRVRLDPWEPDYEGAIQLPSEDGPADVDLQVEHRSWTAVVPAAVRAPDTIFFVDGVRRIEHRILVETETRTLFGVLGSLAAGATRVGTRAETVARGVRRVAAIGGGGEPTWNLRLAVGATSLSFDSLPVAENTPEASVEGLQNAMRQQEAAVAESLCADDALVFLDGRLTFFTATRLPVVGLVKRLLRNYLPPSESLLLRTLPVGQRTPIFLIKETRHDWYSWYTRIATGRRIDSALTGVVRVETSSALAMQAVRRLADLSARVLPRFASAPGHDPRAPQNLYPIGGLERALRHLMGDPLVVRRAIEAHLYAGEVAA